MKNAIDHPNQIEKPKAHRPRTYNCHSIFVCRPIKSRIPVIPWKIPKGNKAQTA